MGIYTSRYSNKELADGKYYCVGISIGTPKFKLAYRLENQCYSLAPKGDSGDAVKEMQKMLIGCGFSCGSSGVDGSFGGDTEKALLAFQAFYGLEQDGKYGPASKSKLVSAYNGKTAASVPEKKNTPSYTAGHEYTLQVELKVRTGPGTNYSAKKHSQLTADGQKHDKDNDGCLDAGTVVTCQEVRNVGNDIWMKAPSGWMAAYYDGKVYIK